MTIHDMNVEKRKRLLEALRGGYMPGAACKMAGLSRNTYYHWRKTDPEFTAEAKDAMSQGYSNYTIRLVELALAGERWALERCLDRHLGAIDAGEQVLPDQLKIEAQRAAQAGAGEDDDWAERFRLIINLDKTAANKG
jgi:hypothetical protein